MKLSDRLLMEVKAQAVEIANLKLNVQYLRENLSNQSDNGQAWRNRAETAEAQLELARKNPVIEDEKIKRELGLLDTSKTLPKVNDTSKTLPKVNDTSKTLGELIKEKLGGWDCKCCGNKTRRLHTYSGAGSFHGYLVCDDCHDTLATRKPKREVPMRIILMSGVPGSGKSQQIVAVDPKEGTPIYEDD